MKVADLYVRVSTDEQAEKGYSPRSQENVLRQYCELRGISVRSVIHEDHSAKTFNRPEWKKLMVLLKKYKNKTDLLLFTKWDRFSRNTSDAYQMIKALKNLGVEPQAVEQPLDVSVPENKMMLAIYLTTPEIENDRRGLNTKAGIRQAKKEGRWTGKAPIGYINKTAETGRRYIALKEPAATIMRWAFEQLAEGIYSAEHIMKGAWEKGLKCSKNNFLHIIRNPVYCGKVIVPQFKEEDTRIVHGQHTPLISEALFYQAQEVLESRTKNGRYGFPIATPKDLPLRNFIKCPKCTRMLTGSASKGRSTYRVYYHCTSKCGVRYRAEEVNNAFTEELMELLPRKGYAELFVDSVTDSYNNQTRSLREERKGLVVQISELNRRIDNARELLLNNDLEAAEFRQIKAECSEKITRVEAQLSELSVQNETWFDIRPIAVSAIAGLCEIDKLWEDAGNEAKRYLVGMLYPERLTYVNGKHRTAKMNQAAELIYLKNKELQAKKMGQKSNFQTLPHEG
jgi:site-specific DNA recombinase